MPNELEFKRYRKNSDEKKKRSLSLKVLNSFDDEFYEINTKDEKDEMALLSKKNCKEFSKIKRIWRR